MPLRKEPNAEPIPGYRLRERLGRGGFGEVWKCEAPGGLFKAIKFVCGNGDGLHEADQAEEELRAVERIKAIRHPFLLSMDRVEVVEGELLIVTELADKNLFNLFQECRQAGLPGIPRSELLAYLREAAEVLDLLNLQHGLQHLDVKPHNFFLVSNHVKVADFGLVSSLGAGGIQLGAITPLYASPEVFLGKLSARSDLYSLAVVYQELLTGTLPYQGKNSRQLLLQHTTGAPDLGALPEAERPLVARALAKDPEERFPTCLDFIRALRAVRGQPAEDRAIDSSIDSALASGPVFVTAQAEAEAETDHAMSVTPHRAAPSKKHKSPPAVAGLPGYRFVECLGSSPLMEVWLGQAPDGRQRLVKLVYGAGPERQRFEDALVRYQLLLHPALTQHEVAQNDPGRLVLVTDLIEDSLRQRYQQCLAQELPGIPREELLGYLRASAEALDYLYQQHSVQHLGLNPRTLLLEQDRPVLADFGLAQLFWLPAGQPVAQRNARYSAPELFEGRTGRSCDQYSLAVIFTEMLTGAHPCRGQNAREAASRPGLEKLSPEDRAIIGRALSADPSQRWPSCTDLVRALAGEEASAAADELADGFSLRLSGRVPTAGTGRVDELGSPLGGLIAQLITAAGGTVAGVAAEDAPLWSADGNSLRHRFSAGVPLGTARLKLDAFRQRCEGRLTRENEHHYAFEVTMPAQLWQQWIGRQPALEVQVGLARQNARAATPIEVMVQVRALQCARKQGRRLLEQMGTSLLEGLRAALLVNAEKRIQDRLLWPHPLQVRVVRPDGALSEPVLCRGKDISLSGIGFYLPHELPTAEVHVELPGTPQTPALTVPATLVRAKRCADGWYEVGALFRLAALRKSLPELCLS
jgi:serine/threonine protein kinase